MALQRPGRRATLVLTWDVNIADTRDELRKKPFDLVGRALAAPHAGSLASALRARGLSPMEVEAEPVVQCKTIAKADGWALWELEITLAAGAEGAPGLARPRTEPAWLAPLASLDLRHVGLRTCTLV